MGGKIFRNEHVNTKGDNYMLSRKIAAESTVYALCPLARYLLIWLSLLKNTGVLPLHDIRRIGVFGSDADYPPTLSGCGGDLICFIASERRYWNGTVTIGGGSGSAYSDYVVRARRPQFLSDSH